MYMSTQEEGRSFYQPKNTIMDQEMNSANHLGYGFSYLKIVFVLILFLISLISFVTQTELTSVLYTKYGFNEPILLLFLTHGFWWCLWPLQFMFIAIFKTLKRYVNYKRGYEVIINGQPKKWRGFRRSIASSIKAQHQNVFHTAELTAAANIPGYKITYTDPKKSFRQYKEFLHSEAIQYVFKMAAILSIILNVAGVTWYVAMSLSTGSDVTAIYNCSAFTAYIFAIPILKERFSWIKANSVVIAISGVFIVAYMGKRSMENSSNNYQHRLLGNFIILIGAIMYGLYEVLYKKWCCPPTELVSARRQATFSNFIMCLIGISTFVSMGLVLLIVQITGIHKFAFPIKATEVIIMLTSIFSNHVFSVCFLGLMSLTSPVFSSVASLLTILIVGAFEWIFRGIVITLAQVIGYIFILAGFSLLTYASWNEISQEDTDDNCYITDSESTYSVSSNQP